MNNTVKTRVLWSSILVIALCTAFLLYLWGNGTVIDASENGPIENGQALLIALSCLLPLMYTIRASVRAERLLLLATALLPFSFFFREVEIKNLELPSAIIFIGSGLPNQLLVMALWLAVVIFMVVFRDGYLKLWAFYLWRQPIGYLLAACLAGLLVAGFVEKGDIEVSSPLFIEELLELVSYALLLLSAVLSAVCAKQAQLSLETTTGP